MANDMKKIKINFADVGINNSYHKEFVLNILKQRYEIEISDQPDFLFCGDYIRNEYLKYKNCVRIHINAEYEFPDYNTYDYVIGMVDCEQNERYLYYPIYMWRDGTSKYFDLAMEKHKKECNPKNKLFCNQLISNSIICDPYRFQIYRELSKYKKVDSAGSYEHNVPFEIGLTPEDKLEFSKNYKFSLAVENTSRKGYVSEKIIEAWAAGTIPIYYGAEDIAEIFNEEAFINCGKAENIQEVIQKIEMIDQNDALYTKMMGEPIVRKDSRALLLANKERVVDFLFHILDQEKELAFRRERICRGILLENIKIQHLKQSYYYDVLNKINSANFLEQNLIENEFYQVAIYGKGIVGEALINKLMQYERIKVVAIFDRNLCGNIYSNIPILNIEQEMKSEINCIINTVYDFSKEVSERYYKTNGKRVRVVEIKDFLGDKYEFF